MSRAGDGADEPALTLQPWASSSSRKTAEHAGSRRPCILLSAEVMKSRRIATGAPVIVAASSTALHQDNKDWCVGAAWPSFSLSGNSACLPPELCHGSQALSTLGSTVTLVAVPGASNGAIPEASTLRLRVRDDKATANLGAEDKRFLSVMLKEKLAEKRYVRLQETIALEFNEREIEFEVSGAVLPASAEMPLCLIVSRATKVVLTKRRGAEQPDVPAPNGSIAESSYTDIGGLDKQIADIRALVELPLLRPDLFTAYGLKPPRGVLLFGPPGTGKTTLARAVAASTRSSVVVINGPELSSAFHGETEAKLRGIFEQAKAKSPCIIVIDEIDALAPRRDAGGGAGVDGAAEAAGEVERRVVATLLTLLDGVDLPAEGADAQAKRPQIVVIAATNRPNAVDPALRRPGRLDREIEIGIPTSAARAAILAVQLKRVPHDCTPSDIEHVAARTHGYVGADLGALVREAGMHAIRAAVAQPADLSEALSRMSVASDLRPITVQDLLDAMSVVKASAMREIAFETPKVFWSDIASGQGGVQQQLRESIEWPLQHPEAFARLGVDRPKGVLLYGPPGCSKTLMARALATESGLNFIAVKGPELFNKYVGESERAVRETFRKARAASPCIIFFDEIDALTTTRGDGDSAGSASDRVIGTLLNEMDGVGEGASVVVVAATNRPEVIDPALLRPGRFDRLLYVAPPDRQARLQILQHRAKRMRTAAEVDFGAIADLTDGCSGAEVMSVCQDAGLLAMARSLEADAVSAADFEQAARNVRRRITPEMLRKFERWRDVVAV